SRTSGEHVRRGRGSRRLAETISVRKFAKARRPFDFAQGRHFAPAQDGRASQSVALFDEEIHRVTLLLVFVKLFCRFGTVLVVTGSLQAEPMRVASPPAGKLYHGCYWGGIGTDQHDPTEHDVTSEDVARYEQAVGKKTAWVYFSDNWFESAEFPAETCRWIRDLGKVPYIRLMLRSDVDQKHAERRFSISKIVAGEFDAELRDWAREARAFRSPILIEWGTEPN